MKHLWLGSLLVAVALAAGPTRARAQEPDYLTREEVELVRATQEPNKRIALFLKFAGDRLLQFEQAVAAGPGAADAAAAKDLLNNFIRAVDDDSDALNVAMERGGVDLRKTHPILLKTGNEFLKRLEHAQESELGKTEELRYDLEDAVMAVNDLLEAAKKIPDAPIPPKTPVAAGEEGKEQQEEPAPPPGKPTLKRRPPPPKPK